LIDFDKFGSIEKLHNHRCSDNGGNTELHESSSVGGENGSHPIEWIGLFALDDTVEWDLTAKQINEDDDTSPDLLGFEGDLNK